MPPRHGCGRHRPDDVLDLLQGGKPLLPPGCGNPDLLAQCLAGLLVFLPGQMLLETDGLLEVKGFEIPIIG